MWTLRMIGFVAVTATIQTTAFGLDPVNVTFQNSTSAPVDIFYVDPDGNAKKYHAGLAPNLQVEQGTYGGQVWRIERNNRVLAEYEVGPEGLQTVDLQELISWQTPIKIVFQNTTEEDELDILLVDRDGKERCYAPELKPGQQLVQTSNPGAVWTVRKHGELVGEYSPDNTPMQTISLEELLEVYARQVPLVFENRGVTPVNINAIDVQEREEVVATALPPNKRVQLTGVQNQLWRIRDSRTGAIVGQYRVPRTNERQIVNVSMLKNPILHESGASSLVRPPRRPPPRPREN